jgi:hypothetical protein
MDQWYTWPPFSIPFFFKVNIFFLCPPPGFCWKFCASYATLLFQCKFSGSLWNSRVCMITLWVVLYLSCVSYLSRIIIGCLT